MQPGSSIMPGKINPVIPEVTSSIVYQLAGYDTTVTMAAELSSLELNPVECIIVYDLVLEKGWLTKQELDDMLKPENMTQPRDWKKK
jgi:aspartate ammonia-lyase